MQFCISAEEGEIYIYIYIYQTLAGNENTSCVTITFVEHPYEYLLNLAHISVIPIYGMALVILYWEHIPKERENECGDAFNLYIKLFGAKFGGFCSMEPSGNLLTAYLKYGWFLVVFFVCQFVYHGTPTVLWSTWNNIIELFS
jgi:hypothetical protein